MPCQSRKYNFLFYLVYLILFFCVFFLLFLFKYKVRISGVQAVETYDVNKIRIASINRSIERRRVVSSQPLTPRTVARMRESKFESASTFPFKIGITYEIKVKNESVRGLNFAI